MHLTARDTAIAALKAHEEKRLSAQGPTPQCSYMDPSGRPCAVGAAMPKDFARLHTNAGTVSHLVSEGYVTCPEGDEEKLEKLQTYHDVWASAVQTTGVDRTARLEADFLRVARELAA